MVWKLKVFRKLCIRVSFVPTNVALVPGIRKIPIRILPNQLPVLLEWQVFRFSVALLTLPEGNPKSLTLIAGTPPLVSPVPVEVIYCFVCQSKHSYQDELRIVKVNNSSVGSIIFLFTIGKDQSLYKKPIYYHRSCYSNSSICFGTN